MPVQHGLLAAPSGDPALSPSTTTTEPALSVKGWGELRASLRGGDIEDSPPGFVEPYDRVPIAQLSAAPRTGAKGRAHVSTQGDANPVLSDASSKGSAAGVRTLLATERLRLEPIAELAGKVGGAGASLGRRAATAPLPMRGATVAVGGGEVGPGMA